MTIDPADRNLIAATQQGLPLTPSPYADIARRIDLSEQEVIDRLSRLKSRGIIRRIALAPNHYALGVLANGMSVWDVDDRAAPELGARIGALPFVSHCYLRPRALPDWPYNLFAMIHGRRREQVEDQRHVIAGLLGGACRAHDILYSTRILKKTGLRLGRAGD